mgnify:CR=1 FL=1
MVKSDNLLPLSHTAFYTTTLDHTLPSSATKPVLVYTQTWPYILLAKIIEIDPA